MSGSGNFTDIDDDVECLAFSSVAKCDAIVWCRRLIAILSLVSCLFIIFVIVALKRYKFQPQRLVLYLIISVFFNTISYVWSDHRVAYMAHMYTGTILHFCIFQGASHILTSWITLLWVCIMTFNISWITVFLKRTGTKFEIVYIPVCLIIPTILTIIPLAVGAYGPAGLWCWISSSRGGERYVPGIALQFTLFYGPWVLFCIVMVAVLAVVSCVIHHRLRKSGKRKAEYGGPSIDAQKNLWQEDIKVLMPYPWIYIATFIFPVINRLWLAIQTHDPESPAHFALWFLHAISLPFPGLLFAFVIIFNKQTMCELKDTLFGWYQRCRGHEDGESEAANKEKTHTELQTPIEAQYPEQVHMTLAPHHPEDKAPADPPHAPEDKTPADPPHHPEDKTPADLPHHLQQAAGQDCEIPADQGPEQADQDR